MRILKVLLPFVMLIAIFIPLNHTNAVTAKSGEVDTGGPTLKVRNGPGTNNERIGTLKNKAKVTVYAIGNGWAQIQFGRRTGYVSDDYLRFYLPVSQITAKALVKKADQTERKTWETDYTKAQIYSIMAPQFTKAYIDRYIPQQFRASGQNSKRKQLYHVIETEIWGLALYPMDWNADQQKPAISHFIKNGDEYLYVSQVHINEESENKTTTICFVKKASKWLVFDHVVKYAN
jgi:hypothetical protein